MSPTGKDTTKTTITSLPTELVSRIVHLSSPKPNWVNATERSAHLRNLTLVCRAFTGPAQEELYRHVILPTLAASRAFVAVLKSRMGVRFASTPRSLRAGAVTGIRFNQDEFALPFIAKRCSRLESMWLGRINTIDVAALASGTGLRELFCTECGFVTALYDRKFEALSLTRLGIRGCLGAASLNPRLFENVISLDLSFAEPDEVKDMTTFANSLGKQLASLCIGDAHEGTPSFGAFEPTHFKNLINLDSRLDLTDVPEILSSLPSRIRHLRVEAPLSAEVATPKDRYKWTLKFIRHNLGGYKNSCLERLDHVRYAGRAMSDERTKRLEDELKALGVDARLSFDDLGDRLSLEIAFNPTFWAFVDDAEAEEAKRLEGI